MINAGSESKGSVKPNRKLFEMNALSKCIRVLIIAGASIGVVSEHVMAQEASKSPSNQSVDSQETEDLESLEEVVITAIRSSLRGAIDRKKEAGTIIDSIVAEDIGDFPDKNIAEALQRVTGVQIGREFGEGTSVSIRGVAPQLVNVEVNGQTAIGASDPFASQGRSVDFAAFAAELVKSLDVIKGSEARLTEGGVGGSIRVTTRKPNDFKENYLQVSGENLYNELTEDHNQKLNVIGVYKFSDTFGGLLNVTASNRNTAFHALRNTEWVLNGDYDQADRRSYVDPEFPNSDTIESCGGDADCLRQFRDFRARIPRYSIWQRDEDRLSANGLLQYAVSDQLSAYVGYTYTSRDFVQQDSNMQLEVASDRQLVADQYLVNDIGNVTQYLTRDALVVNRSINNDWKLVTSVFDAGFEYKTGNWNVKGALGYSEQTQDIDQVETRVASDRVQDVLVTFGANGAPGFDLNQGTNRDTANPTSQFNLNDPDAYWHYARIQPENFEQQNDQLTIKLDAVYDFDDSFFDKLRTGFRYSSEYQDHSRERYRITAVTPNPGRDGEWTQEEQNALVRAASFQTSGFMGGYDVGVPIPDGWLALDPARFETEFNRAYGDQITDDMRVFAPLAFYEVEMDIAAFYVQGEFRTEVGGLPLWGNVGARYVSAEIDTLGDANVQVQVDDPNAPPPADGDFPANILLSAPDHPQAFNERRSISHDYAEVLPSLNVNLELIPDELVLYFGAAKVLAHPQAKDLNIAASCTIRLDTASISAGNPNSCRAGNPRLDPYLANQWDVALNWYPNKDSILAAAYFEKKIDTWVIDRNETFDQDFFGDGTLYDVTQVINGSGITTKGVELSASSFFSVLPGFLANTGAAVNYTYLTADDVGIFNQLTGEELPFPSQSENSYNITLFYETEQVSLKFAYNYRDEYLVLPSDRGGNPVYIADAGILDAKVVYRPQALENLKFTFDVRNLTEEGNEYENGPGRVSEIRYSGREFSAGFTYTF